MCFQWGGIKYPLGMKHVLEDNPLSLLPIPLLMITKPTRPGMIGDGVEELPKLARQIIPYPASAVLILQLSPGSPRARRMVSEFYRAAETLADNYPPMKAVHVDLSSLATDHRSKGRKGGRQSSREVAIAYRRELEAITGVSTFLGDNPELRYAYIAY